MADLSTLPLIDWFETTLAQQYTGGLGTMYVNDTPDFTFPSWVKTYAVVNPGKSIQQVVEIDSMGVGTLNVSSVTVEKGAGVNYTAQTHSANNKVIISDNYQFWKDIRTAVNTKLDTNGGNWVDYADTAARDAALGADGAATKNYRNIKAWSVYYNYNLSTWQWQAISTGTAPAFATTTTSGIAEVGTTADVTAWTDTGGSGWPTFVQPSQLKTTNDNLAAEALKIKDKVDVVAATTANITLSGTQTIDGVAVTAGQRVLVKNQTAWAENGIYLCAAWSWTRVTDFDANANNEVDLGANVWVQGGTVGAWTQWALTTTGAITVGTTALTFARTYPQSLVGCKATQSTGTSITAGAFGTVWFDAEAFDTHVFHDNSTNNSRITIPAWQAWIYEFVWQVGGSANYTGIKIRKNGSTVIAEQYLGDTWSYTGANTPTTLNVTWIDTAVATDYYELQVYCKTSNTTTTIWSTFFYAKKVG